MNTTHVSAKNLSIAEPFAQEKCSSNITFFVHKHTIYANLSMTIQTNFWLKNLSTRITIKRHLQLIKKFWYQNIALLVHKPLIYANLSMTVQTNFLLESLSTIITL